jgi:hypothetical protein
MRRLRHPFLVLLVLLVSTATIDALHFYLDANEKRCFIEELPTDTVVEGMWRTIPMIKSVSLIQPHFYRQQQDIIAHWSGLRRNKSTLRTQI